MSRLRRLHGLLGAFILNASGPLTAALEPGVGSFEFTIPRSGQTMTVHYVRAENYNPAHPPVMVFHGMLRNPDEYRDTWIGLAREHGLFVVAPHFSAEQFPGTESYNLGNLFASETDLTPKPEAAWSYPVPGELFDYLRRPGSETTASGYLAFGHSAGSQYLHRKIALSPDPRLLFIVAANAGWYTFPDKAIQWPYGLGGTPFTEAGFPAYLAANMVVQLGNADIDPAHDSLRRTPEAMRQGEHRLERGLAFFKAGKLAAAARQIDFNWRLQIVDGVEHDNKAIAPFAAQLMADFIATHQPAEQAVDPE